MLQRVRLQNNRLKLRGLWAVAFRSLLDRGSRSNHGSGTCGVRATLWCLLVLLALPRAIAQEPAGPRLETIELQPLPPTPSAPAAPATSPARPAQSEPLPPPPLQFESIPPAPAPVPVGPVPCPTCRQPEGYWIVSSWKCRQAAPHGCACGDLEFYYRSEGGPTQLLNREAFHASLTPGAPVCFVVHGSFTSWKGLCGDCGPEYRWIRGPAPMRPLTVVFYTWPSTAPIAYEPHLDVAILGMRASFNAVYLGDLISRMPPGQMVCVMGHSHGARMAAATLHLLAGGEVEGTHLSYLPSPQTRIRSVLVAAAMDHHWLDPGQRYGLAMCRAECLLYMRNDHDMVLSIYPFRRVFSRRALGEKGLSRGDQERLGPLNSKIVQLDVTNVIQSGHMGNNYYIHPELAQAIEPYVYFDDPIPGNMPPQSFPPQRPAAVSRDSLAAAQSAAGAGDAKEPRRVFAGLRSRLLKPTNGDSPSGDSAQ